MSKISKPSNIVLPTPEEDAEILAAALADPDAPPLTDEQLKAMVPLASLHDRPKPERELPVAIRFSPEVIAYFKATGEGWQSRMNRVLLDYVNSQAR